VPLEKRGFDLNRILCRQLQQEDIAFAYEMTKTEMWNVTIEDVQRMFKFEPDGCFMAELEELRLVMFFQSPTETLAGLACSSSRKNLEEWE
jgi:hypothetical protein